MVLLDAFASRRGDAVLVATFDHGTGAAARRAVRLVETEAARRGVRVVRGRPAAATRATEDAWRAARWAFLRNAAHDAGAMVVTAHTRDDQLETVVMRALRDPRHTSARGLAAMYSRSSIARPFLERTRGEVAAWARARRVRFLEDPTNASRAFLRNRLRLDLLPAIERAHPGFGDAMLALSRRAARWRVEMDALAESLGDRLPYAVVIPSADVASIPPEGLAVLWPAFAARLGIPMDWRGTERVVAFTLQAKAGGWIPMSGGARLERTHATFVLRASGA
jgi:tRNA(Ile)-lysidine synthase